MLTPDYSDELANITASQWQRAEMLARHAGHAAFEGATDIAAELLAEASRLTFESRSNLPETSHQLQELSNAA